jgi:hypothetical protein
VSEWLKTHRDRQVKYRNRFVIRSSCFPARGLAEDVLQHLQCEGLGGDLGRECRLGGARLEMGQRLSDRQSIFGTMNVAVQMIVKAVQGNLEAPARQATTVERTFQSSSILAATGPFRKANSIPKAQRSSLSYTNRNSRISIATGVIDGYRP